MAGRVDHVGEGVGIHPPEVPTIEQAFSTRFRSADMDIAEMEVVPIAHREPPLRNSWGAHSELAAPSSD